MANQERKYWPLAIEAASKLDAWLWVHSDLMRYYWDIEALAIEYGMAKKIIWEGGEVLGREFTDEELALRYSSLDALIIVSGGEGFCYPVAEAMSCGTPVVTGAYGAQAELVGEPLAAPSGLFVHTIHNVVRASYRAESVLAVAQKVIGSDRKWWAGRAEHLDWTKLGRVWKKWFRRGLA
jgi:glycosyltransferase involved in cell wall biosynthesis